MIDINDIIYIQASGHYSERHLTDGAIQLHDKNLERLLLILPPTFQRVHKSYAVDLQQIKTLKKLGGSNYSLELNNRENIPLGRTRYAELKTNWEVDVPSPQSITS